MKKEAFMKKGFGFFLILAMSLSGCEMKSVMTTQALPLEEDGEVFVYTEPFPQQAERLKFSCEGFTAVKSDGTEYPITQGFTDLGGSPTQRQRLFASGQLPPGNYTGFSIKTTKATLTLEEGEAALLLPDTPVKIDFPFTVERKRAVVISMSFRYAESVKGGYAFSPSFSSYIPSKPLISVTGYVTNRASHSITVFDKRSGFAAAVIETGMSPSGVVFDQNARRAYVALSGEDAVEVIDVTAGEVINRIALHTGDKPGDLVLTPDGRTLLTANTGSNSVSFIDPFSLGETGRISVGNDPEFLLLDQPGRRLYVFNNRSNSISVIDIPNKSIFATVSTEAGPFRGRFNRRGDKLYVIFTGSPYLVTLDPLSLSVVRRIYVGSGMASIKVDTKRDFIYLGRQHDRTVDVYDPFSLIPGDFIKAGAGVEYMTIDGEGNNLCMVTPQKKAVEIVNLISKNLLSEIDVGEGPYRVALMGEK